MHSSGLRSQCLGVSAYESTFDKSVHAPGSDGLTWGLLMIFAGQLRPVEERTLTVVTDPRFTPNT